MPVSSIVVQMVLYPSVTIIEWISVVSMLLWAALIGVDMLRPH